MPLPARVFAYLKTGFLPAFSAYTGTETDQDRRSTMFREIAPKKLSENVFSLFDDRWTLITAGTQDRCNTMTASWGTMGVLWGKNVVYIFMIKLNFLYY